MITSPFYSHLDSERFGIKVAKINEFPENPNALIEELRSQGFQLIISKIDADSILLINQLEKIGFELKDSQVTYKYTLDNKELNFTAHFDSDLQLRTAVEDDIPLLEKIAVESFRDYGHYANDSRIDSNAIPAIYSDWIKRSCLEREVADIVFVAENDFGIAGFLSMKKMKYNSSNYAAGGLGAVSSKFRGKNVFKLLTQEALKWGVSQNLDWEEHNVLTTNFPVNATFSSLGFKIYKSFFTFHYWF